MRRILISNILSGIIFGAIYYFFISEDITELVLVTLGFVALSMLLEIVLKKRKTKRGITEVTTVGDAEAAKFIDALGGRTNITSASHEASRVKVSLKDVDLINQEQLKSLELEGAFLSGDHLQVTVGKQAASMAQQINGQIK